MTDKASYRKGYLTAEFVSLSYRISAEVNLRNGPLIEVLNDKISEIMRLENTYISPIQDPATLKGHYPIGQLFKKNLNYVLVNREEEAFPRRMAQVQNLPAPTFKVFLTIADFEIRGVLRIENAVDIDRLIVHGGDRFIPIYAATATVSNNPNIYFTGGAALVNRDGIGVFCVEKLT
jgi:hypothetical protein